MLLSLSTLFYPANLTQQVHLLAPDPLPRPHLEMDSISPLTAAEASPVSGLLVLGVDEAVCDAVGLSTMRLLLLSKPWRRR